MFVGHKEDDQLAVSKWIELFCCKKYPSKPCIDDFGMPGFKVNLNKIFSNVVITLTLL